MRRIHEAKSQAAVIVKHIYKNVFQVKLRQIKCMLQSHCISVHSGVTALINYIGIHTRPVSVWNQHLTCLGHMLWTPCKRKLGGVFHFDTNFCSLAVWKKIIPTEGFLTGALNHISVFKHWEHHLKTTHGIHMWDTQIHRPIIIVGQ